MQNIAQLVLNYTSTLVVVLDFNGAINYVSPSIKNLLGLDSHEIVGKNWLDLTRKSDTEKQLTKEKINNFILSEQQSLPPYEQQIFNNNASKWILWSVVKSPDNYLISIGQDIDKQKEAELTIQRKNSELTDLVKDFNDSINYAARLQKAILKDSSSLKKMVEDSFIYFEPKEELSGDIYWFDEVNGYIFAAVIDCTGHGVPGALISIIANTMLKDIIKKNNILEPNEILNLLDNEFVRYLHENVSSDEIYQDGMDLSLIRLNKKTNEVVYAGAQRPLLIMTNGEFIEIKPNKIPIGYKYNSLASFEQEKITLKKGDLIIAYSDGYVDQFGGELGKKFKRKRFKETLIELENLGGEEQRAYLEYVFKGWKQQEPQIDDVTVMGIRI